MIARIWHGYTTPEKANAYEALLRHEIFKGISERKIEGFKDINLLKREVNSEVEFITIMWFEHFDAVKKFAGEEYATAIVPEEAIALLKRFDNESQHYEVVK
jgi:hypothetical protein